MQRQAGHELAQDVAVATGTHGGIVSGGEALDVMGFDTDLSIAYDSNAQSPTLRWSSTVEDSFVHTMEPESRTDLELRALMEHIDELEEFHTGCNSTNPILTSTLLGGSVGSQPPPPAAPSINPDTIPIIRSEHQSYLCSWHTHGSDVRCDYTAPDRRAFLHHLGAAHQVSGDPRVTIICGLSDPKMGSICRASVKRANFPRHVDTHYPLRYQCQHCPVGTSFSRQDSWKKHMRSKHT